MSPAMFSCLGCGTDSMSCSALQEEHAVGHRAVAFSAFLTSSLSYKECLVATVASDSTDATPLTPSAREVGFFCITHS
eukprot:6474464-Amphidinium_carterae.1